MRASIFLITLFSFFTISYLIGATITGRVLSPDGHPVSYANVMIEGSKIGSTTNLNGEFKITDVPEGSAIVKASHISFGSVELKVNIPCNYLTLKFKQESVISLSDAVVVTATRTPKTLKETPLPVTLIPKESIEEIQAVSLSDAIEQVPGIVMVPNGFTRNSATIHGLPEEYTLLLVDGQRVYGRHAEAKDFDNIPAGMIERIEILKGPSSVLFGSDAVAGIVNVITKSGQSSPYFELYGFGGSNSRYTTRIMAGGRIGEIRNFLSASYNKSGQMAKGYGFSNINMRYNGRVSPSEKSEIRFGGGIFSEKTEDMPPAEGHEEGGPYLTDDVYDINLGYHHETGSKTTYDFSAYLYNQDRWDNRPGRADRRWKRNHIRLEGLSGFRRGNHELLIGAEGRSESLDHTQIPQTKNQFLISLFGQDTWTLNERVSLVTAVRFENHDRWGLVFVPRLGLAWKTNDQLNIRISGGSSFRAPSLEDLFIETYFHPWGGGFWLGGNKDLKPEKGIGANLDFEWIANVKTVLTVGVFYNRLKDRIASLETDQIIQGAPVKKLGNVEKASSYGVDVQFNRILWSGAKLGVTYGYTYSEDGSSGKPFPLTPYHKGGFSFNWRHRKLGTNFYLSANYLGERSTSRETLKGVIILNANIEKQILGGMSLFVAGNNMLNKNLYPSRYINFGSYYRFGIRLRK
ncbi:MAG: TonB-dependent receptor [Calditrichaeota bacterium]|nr:TonB-dependent receptor [Calditrichota bacterium]